MKKEIWKDIPKYKGYYQISNHGRVRSLDRTIEYTSRTKFGEPFKVQRFLKGAVRVVSKCRTGYALVVGCVRGKNRNIRPAKCVAEAFLPPRTKEQTQINHIDGNPMNNHVDNLEWCTAQENMTHAKETGLLKGRDNSKILTWQHVNAIRELYKGGNFSQWDLARMFDVTQPHINNILANRTWKLPRK